MGCVHAEAAATKNMSPWLHALPSISLFGLPAIIQALAIVYFYQDTPMPRASERKSGHMAKRNTIGTRSKDNSLRSFAIYFPQR